MLTIWSFTNASIPRSTNSLQVSFAAARYGLPYNAISMYAYLFVGYQLTAIHTQRVRTNAPVEILDKTLDEPQETRRTRRKACLDDCGII